MHDTERLSGLIAYCDQHIRDARDDEYGRSCDERGCAICNGASSKDVALEWIAMADAGEATLPPDEHLEDAPEGAH
jgi:hypothetical protein